MVELGAACLIAAPVRVRCTRSSRRSCGARRGDRRLVDSSRRAVYALCALLTVSVVVLEAAFLRIDFSVALVAEHSSTTTPLGYKLTAMWSSQGGSLLLWALGALDRLQRRAVSHPQPPPRGRALGDRGARRARALLHRADAVRGQPVRAARPGAGGGHRPQPAAAPPGDGDPPADALLGLRAVVDPVRVRDRGADHAAGSTRAGSGRRAGSRSSPGSSSASGSCSAPAGRTRSSAGAATGGGTRSRTPR